MLQSQNQVHTGKKASAQRLSRNSLTRLRLKLTRAMQKAGMGIAEGSFQDRMVWWLEGQCRELLKAKIMVD